MDTRAPASPPLIDRFGRHVTYVRLSVTDRCDLRCVYCMNEQMTFLPKARILTLEEMALIGRAFVELGVTKLRITGGEPLVRQNVLSLFAELGKLPGLKELTLTTNGSQLVRHAAALREAGVRRINVSLDSLRPERFRAISRVGSLDKVLEGIEAARRAGFEAIKLNAVPMRGINDDEILDLVEFAAERDFTVCFIEEMPLGEIDGHDRRTSFVPSDEVRARISERYTLLPTVERTGGPARYERIAETGTLVGFISPHSHNFCDSCNRVRVTTEGRLLLCLGQEHSVDLRRVLRTHPGALEPLKEAIVAAMAIKPKGHEFDLTAKPVLFRHMNATGG